MYNHLGDDCDFNNYFELSVNPAAMAAVGDSA